ncbi:hypothetical protein C1922_06095 [Stenotrophomonas sp. ZAC14D2_NAIMI4_7]|nr:hypothetical protein C1922_06095 [Stenotrophomonas sp. ZAC14D2_NAIMI4_7]
MVGNTSQVSGRFIASCCTQFFCPPPASMECASDSTWGAHRLRVEIPGSLAECSPRNLGHSACRLSTPIRLPWVELLCHRLNTQGDRPGVFGRMHNSGLQRLAAIVAPTAMAGIASGYFNIARALGCDAKQRSSFCWLGSEGPVASAGVFGPADRIFEQLADLQEFIDQTADCNPAWRAEAIAYQLFMIHPLADGNGRAVRALTIGFHRRYQCVEALYLFWCLKYFRRTLFDQWKMSRCIGKFICAEGSFFRWQDSATALNDAFESLLRQGLPRQVVAALCLHGEVTVGSVRACDGGIGDKAALRMVVRWQEWCQREGGKQLALLDAAIRSMTVSSRSSEAKDDVRVAA